MFGKDSKKPQSRIDSLIGVGTEIEGNISFSGGLRVDGLVRGNITSTGDQPGMLVISEHAEVEGEIRVHHVMVNGKVLESGTPEQIRASPAVQEAYLGSEEVLHE